LAVEDMSKSRWEQIEAIEALERGEGTKGREIIRVAAPVEGDDVGGNVQRGGGGPHKLLLQDATGRRAYGIELKALEGVGVGMSIGCKLVLRDAVVARGVVLLEPGSTVVLGGKIEAMHKAWREGRKAALKKAIEDSELGARGRG
jgi:RecQ-mediated genome instability protein 1